MEGKMNRTRIMLILNNQPLTFSKLREKVQLSKPVLSNHLRLLEETNSIERAIDGKSVVYQVVSTEETRIVVKAALFDLVAKLLPFGIGNKIDAFVDDFSNAILEMGEDKAVEEKFLKPLRERKKRKPEELIQIDDYEDTDQIEKNNQGEE